MIKIPKFVQELMSRASFVLGSGEAGYTVRIYKSTEYAYVSTLQKEVETLNKWVIRVMPEDDLGVPTMIINSVPKKTHYCKQYAVVTIYDPVMKWIEQYIKKEY
jgi:hypothetical protein